MRVLLVDFRNMVVQRLGMIGDVFLVDHVMHHDRRITFRDLRTMGLGGWRCGIPNKLINWPMHLVSRRELARLAILDFVEEYLQRMRDSNLAVKDMRLSHHWPGLVRCNKNLSTFSLLGWCKIQKVSNLVLGPIDYRSYGGAVLHA